MNPTIAASLASAYATLTLYWTGRRMVGGWQTVEFISNQAAHCARLTATYTRLSQVNTDGMEVKG